MEQEPSGKGATADRQVDAVAMIDEDVEIQGRLTVRGCRELVVRGLVDGHIESAGRVVIDAGGVLRGTLSARELEVAGRIEGGELVRVEGLLDMRSGGQLHAGRIVYGELQHERGARMSGELAPLDSPAPAQRERLDRGQAERGPKDGSFAEVEVEPSAPKAWPTVFGPPVLDAPAEGATVTPLRRPEPLSGVGDLAFRSDLPPLTAILPVLHDGLDEVPIERVARDR